MALWQLLGLTAALITRITAESYGYNHPQLPYSSYGPHNGYEEDYPSYDRDYSFNYGVKDDHTYNYQTRDEVKKGNTVYGSYSVVEPDGNLRVVKYEADDYGFRATVDRDGVAPTQSYGVAGPPSSYPIYKEPVAPSSYKASLPPYTATVPYPSYKAHTSYKAPSVYKGPAVAYQKPYKAPIRAHIYNQPKLPQVYNAYSSYKAPPTSYFRSTYKTRPANYNSKSNYKSPSYPTSYAKAPNYSEYMTPVAYSAYKAGTNYKQPAYNYDDEY